MEENLSLVAVGDEETTNQVPASFLNVLYTIYNLFSSIWVEINGRFGYKYGAKLNSSSVKLNIRKNQSPTLCA